MKQRSSRRAKACDISPKVKKRVAERDCGMCIFCGRPGIPNMHFIPRSAGGLGVEENIGTGCIECHDLLDHTTKRKAMLIRFEQHLRSHYPNWDKSKLIYSKWKGFTYA